MAVTTRPSVGDMACTKYIDALDKLQTVRSIALQGQADCGRGISGREWSILVTETEKLIALLRHYRPVDKTHKEDGDDQS